MLRVICYNAAVQQFTPMKLSNCCTEIRQTLFHTIYGLQTAQTPAS